MRKLYPNPIAILMAAWFSLLPLASATAAEPAWKDYAQLLARHVRPVTRHGVALNGVDYRALAQDPLFGRVTTALARFDPTRLEGRQERLAFYINAYNILAIKVVLDNLPLDSIKDAGSLFNPVWKRTAGVIGGHRVSLDEIEHGILRPLGDPRVHMAIVCASVSCPDLRREPYLAARLDRQLAAQATAFLANPAKGLRLQSDGIHVSRIFAWFEEDFKRTYGGVGAFLRRYHTGLPPRLAVTADLPYDWSLNDSGRSP